MAIGFSKDIRPLFNNVDIQHMSFFCNLSNYNDVKTNAETILGRLNGTSGPQMPPAADGGPWSQANIAKFQTWIKEGCQP